MTDEEAAAIAAAFAVLAARGIHLRGAATSRRDYISPWAEQARAEAVDDGIAARD